jgi:GAF domain-containing protein
MYPSATFWLDTLVNLVTGLVALVLLALAIVLGLRRRLHPSFGLFAASAALVGLGTAVANLTLWLDSRVPLPWPGRARVADSGGFGNPLLWMELAIVGFYFVGPAVLAFTVAFSKTRTESGEPPNTRWHKAVAITGFLAGLGLLPAVFNGQIITHTYLDQADLVRWEITRLGHVVPAGPLLLELLALLLLWRNRQRQAGTALAIGIAILLMAGIAAAPAVSRVERLGALPFPFASLIFAAGVLVTGYVVISQQIYSPVRRYIKRLEGTTVECARQLQKSRDKLGRLKEGQCLVAQIGREIAQVADPNAMLARLAELIHDRLGYPHVFIYQPDQDHQELIIQAAAGPSAGALIKGGQRLPVGAHALAAQAASERRARFAEASNEDAIYFEETALPDACAEIAVPLLVGDRLLAVLDLQSTQLEAFSYEDLALLTTLADQVAVTLDNVRLLQEAQAARAELEKAHRQGLRQAWQSAIGGTENTPAYVYSDGDGITETNLSAAWSPEIAQAATAGQPLASDETTLTLPIVLRGQVIGALQLRHKPGRAWQPDEIETLGSVAERLALALENARLIEETQRRVAREQLTREITDQMRESMNVSTILQRTIQQLGQAVGAEEVAVRIMPPALHSGPVRPEGRPGDTTPMGQRSREFGDDGSQ